MKRIFLISLMMFTLHTVWGFKVEETNEFFTYVESHDSYRSITQGQDMEPDVFSTFIYRLETDKRLEFGIRIEYLHLQGNLKENGVSEIEFNGSNDTYTVNTEYLYQEEASTPFLFYSPEETDFSFDFTSMKCNGKAMTLNEIVRVLTSNNMKSVRYCGYELINFMPTPTAEKLRPQLQEMYKEAKKTFGSRMDPLGAALYPQKSKSATSSTSSSPGKKPTSKSGGSAAFLSNFKAASQNNGKDLCLNFDVEYGENCWDKAYLQFYIYNTDTKKYVKDETGNEDLRQVKLTSSGWIITSDVMKSQPVGNYTVEVAVLVGLIRLTDRKFYGPVRWDGRKFDTTDAEAR